MTAACLAAQRILSHTHSVLREKSRKQKCIATKNSLQHEEIKLFSEVILENRDHLTSCFVVPSQELVLVVPSQELGREVPSQNVRVAKVLERVVRRPALR